MTIRLRGLPLGMSCLTRSCPCRNSWSKSGSDPEPARQGPCRRPLPSPHSIGAPPYPYNVSNLQNHGASVIFHLRMYGFRETPASASWYDGVAKRPDTDEDNKDAGDVAEGDTIHILAPYSRRTSALAR